MKKSICDFIDAKTPKMTEMADFIFDNPELGLQEHKASTMLCDYLEENGFSVRRGLEELDTAFIGTYENGVGGPSIGILVEYDALEGLGHACGHHLQGPALITSAIAIKELYQEKPYKLIVFGTPAEETTSGKLTMLRNGYFQDIDVALMMHGNPGTTVDVQSMAMIKYEVTFHGKSAHAALKPEAGRSALDALLLAFHGLEFMREHTADDTRIHYTVLNAGGAANSVPKTAVGSFYVRTYNTDYLFELDRRFANVMQGAALMTETTADIVKVKELQAKVPVHGLNDLIMDNAAYFGTDDICPPRIKTGSSDFGNVMYKVPGTCLRMGFVPKGTSSHSQEYLDAGKTDAAVRALNLSGKIIAGTCYDLISDPSLMAKIKAEFNETKQATTTA